MADQNVLASREACYEYFIKNIDSVGDEYITYQKGGVQLQGVTGADIYFKLMDGYLSKVLDNVDHLDSRSQFYVNDDVTSHKTMWFSYTDDIDVTVNVEFSKDDTVEQIFDAYSQGYKRAIAAKIENGYYGDASVAIQDRDN
ncbi:hypothetical protein [Companilactobacillus kimchiensis]|uniref:Uncharacterized protein n=1 Tax=Companilactobacillus kimchiensis TaxID=993692 RepID=A0A0R2LMA3_9LACO|nr:hypothetical protein [Companilactobacillus kimchiensis]KRO00512.1 hypothetical protein IV57_GL000948 [Companilactobacillus kimchiensis]